MRRKIDGRLRRWKDSEDRKPLVVTGPRQIGKTYSVIEFGKECFSNTVLLNFQESVQLQRIFDGDLTPSRLLRELSAYSQETIDEDTLLVFDEVQECGRALSSLRNFSEEMGEQPLIATGSLLGLYIGPKKKGYDKGESFPTGRVETAPMHPMDLEEFAWATDRSGLADSIRDHFADMSEMPLHESALEMYREYLSIGGMPAAVDAFVRTGDPDVSMSVQKELNNGMIGDISKHSESPEDIVRTMRVWNSMTSQLMKDNLKFQYSKVQRGGRSAVFGASVDWLVSAGMTDRCRMVTELSVPLDAYADEDSFRLFMCDTGLLCSKAEVPFKAVTAGTASDRFRGVMAENYTMQMLTARDVKAYYWNPDQNTEVDFVMQDSDTNIVPIEVKSGDRTGSKSLARCRERYHPRSAIRLSAKNFGYEDGLFSIPLYAAHLIGEDWARTADRFAGTAEHR